MKLKVQMVEFPSGKHLAVTDENDVALPMIASVEVRSTPNDLDKVIVTFLLDDDQVKIVERK